MQSGKFVVDNLKGKHGFIGAISYPRISALTAAIKYEPDLSIPEDRIFDKISNTILGNEEKGRSSI